MNATVLPLMPPAVSHRCRVCRRSLKDPISVQLGIGPVCRAKITRATQEFSYPDRYDIVFDPNDRDIRCKVDGDTNRFNIWQAHRHHSPAGMGWGYNGSAPADFALNILAVFEDQFPTIFCGMATKRWVKLWDGTSVHPLVWDAHQDFKADVVARLPEQGGRITGDFMKSWIAQWLDRLPEERGYPSVYRVGAYQDVGE